MKKRIISFLRLVSGTVKNNPAEITIIIICFIVSSLIRESIITTNKSYPSIFPLFFILSYLLNKWFPKMPWRSLYYLTPLLAFPFFLIDVSGWVFSVEYFVALVIAGLMLFIRNWITENKLFTFQAIHYSINLLQALLLSGCAYLLLIGIYYSVTYIFNIFTESVYDVSIYLSMVCFIIGTPWLFLTFNNRSEEAPEEKNRKTITDILTDYIVSPALVVYTVILYIYFATILFSWSLPKGGIAYMVFAFTLVAVCAKALQPFLLKQTYSRYYRHFSLISIPAQLMFWIGVIYRIQQYGFTTSRTYLVICGVIMSVTLFLFLSKKAGRYLYVAALSIVLLASFTYIPGITAKNIGIKSQLERINVLSQDLGLSGKTGRLKDIPKTTNDSLLYNPKYNQLYESFLYIQREKGEDFVQKEYGIPSLPEPQGKERNTAYQFISLPDFNGKTKKVDISMYQSLYPINLSDSCENINVDTSEKKLLIKDGNNILLNISFDELQTMLLQKSGLTKNATKDAFIQHENSLTNYETDSLYVSFERITFNSDPELHINDLQVDYILRK